MTTTAELSVQLEIPDAVISVVSSKIAAVLAPVYGPYSEALRPQFALVEEALNSYLPPSPLTAKLPLLTVSSMTFALVAYSALIVLLFLVSRIFVARYTLLSVIHNAAMVALSAYMAVGLSVTAHACGISGWNNGVGGTECDRRLAKLIWLFYVSKIFEFVDTFLMLLKGNYRQVTFLHVYHHTTVYSIWFLCARWGPGGETYFSSASNCFIHVFMYSYYLLTTLFQSGRVRSWLQRRKYVITQLQMLQFAANAAQAVYDLYIVRRPDLKYPAEMMQLLLWYMVSLLVLFYNFLSRDRVRQREALSTAGKSAALRPPKQAPKPKAEAVASPVSAKPQASSAAANVVGKASPKATAANASKPSPKSAVSPSDGKAGAKASPRKEGRSSGKK